MQLHVITTSGSPLIRNHLRWLTPDKMKVAKTEFSQIMEIGIAFPSNGNCASSISHLVGLQQLWDPHHGHKTGYVLYSTLHTHDIPAAAQGQYVFTRLFLLPPDPGGAVGYTQHCYYYSILFV